MRAHIVVAVGDLQRSIAFYETLTGSPSYVSGRVNDTRVARAMGFDKVAFRYAAIELPNVRLVLREFDEPVPWRGAVEIVDNGNVHVCLEVGDLNAAISRLHRTDMSINGPSAPAPAPHEREGIDRVIYIDGPDGEHVELVGTANGARAST